MLLWRAWEANELLSRFNSASLSFLDPISLVKRAIPKSAPIKVTEIIPRLKEGGAYVKFTYPKDISATKIEGMPYAPRSRRSFLALTNTSLLS